MCNPTLDPVDYQDHLCRDHDIGYCKYKDNPDYLNYYDEELANKSYDLGFSGKLVYLAMKAQQKKRGGSVIKPPKASVKQMTTQRKGSKTTLAPAAVGRMIKPRQPIINSKSNTGKRIIHSELVGTVTGSDSFTVKNALALNPGVASTFPWLSGQAIFWEQYRFNKLVFEYVPRCGTGQAGSVIMAPDYDALDNQPITESAMSSYSEVVEDSPWKNIVTSLDPKAMFPIGPRKYLRTGNVTGDLKTYDAGTFFLATSDCGGTPGLGKLWVHYDVDLFVPQTSPAGSVARQTAGYYLANQQNLTSTISTSVLYDTVWSSAFGITGPDVSGVFTMPAGVFAINSVVTMADSANENVQCAVALIKNGVAVPGGQTVVRTGTGVAAALNIVVQGLVSFVAGDTLRVSVTPIGASGTLTLPANDSSIMFYIG